MSDLHSERPQDGALNAAISNAVVRILADYTGRGPTKARTTIRDDLVVVLLEDQLTKAERTLVSVGEMEKVMDIRRLFQRTMKDEAVARIEQLTGRRVLAYMSANHAEPDLAVELFQLEPPSRQ
jgi:uncharacterized protein YbcI